MNKKTTWALNFFVRNASEMLKRCEKSFFWKSSECPHPRAPLLVIFELGQSALLLLVVCIWMERPDVCTEWRKHNIRTTWHARLLILYTRWFLYDIDMWFMYSFDHFALNLPHASRFSYFRLLPMQICLKTIKFWVSKVAEMVKKHDYLTPYPNTISIVG